MAVFSKAETEYGIDTAKAGGLDDFIYGVSGVGGACEIGLDV